MLSNSQFKIHTYQGNYCINDIVNQCNISSKPKDYIGSISDKVIYNSQSYLSKDKICELLSKSKAKKSKELLQYLQDPNTPKEKLDIVSLDKNTNELINFVDHKQNTIHFNNKALKYFIYNEPGKLHSNLTATLSEKSKIFLIMNNFISRLKMLLIF